LDACNLPPPEGDGNGPAPGIPPTPSTDGASEEALAAEVRRLLGPKHIEDLKASDLSDAQIVACGFRTLDPSRTGYFLNRNRRWCDARGECLAIPYVGLDGKPMVCFDRDTGETITDAAGNPIPYASFKPRNPIDPKRKYEVRYGARFRAYFPPNTRAKIADPNTPVILVEGQKKAARGDQDGYACVGLNGVECWGAPRPKGLDGKKVGDRVLMADLAALTWKGRRVFICFDSDIQEKPGVQRAEYALAKALRKAGAKVKCVRLPHLPGGQKCGLDDYLKAHGKEEFDKLLAAATRPRRPGYRPKPKSSGGPAGPAGTPPAAPAPVPGGPGPRRRPEITHNRLQYDEVESLALSALVDSNCGDPRIFVGNGGFLSQVYRPEAGGPLVVRRLDANSLRPIFGGIITWKRATEESEYDDFPPHALLSSFPARGEWSGIPPLRSVVSYPSYGPGWQLIAGQGYHAGTGIYCDLNGLAVPTVAECPGPGDVAEAKRLLLGELLYDFPFRDDASLANALAMLILPVVRDAIEGPTPLGVIDAPTEGTGKSLLAEVIGLITVGDLPEALSPDVDNAEWNKTLLAVLMESQPIVYLDNANQRLDSASLASALTAKWKRGRVLGETRMARARVNVSWLLTSNNFKCSREIGRRSYWARIDAGVETPSTREGFKHPRLLEWVRENRPRLLWAVLTLVANWRARGAKPGAATLGKFEEWAGVLGGILEAAGISGFLANADEFRRRCPDQVNEVAAFVGAWHEKFQGEPKIAGELYFVAMVTLEGVLDAPTEGGAEAATGPLPGLAPRPRGGGLSDRERLRGQVGAGQVQVGAGRGRGVAATEGPPGRRDGGGRRPGPQRLRRACGVILRQV
jgi:hypothetical protein